MAVHKHDVLNDNGEPIVYFAMPKGPKDKTYIMFNERHEFVAKQTLAHKLGTCPDDITERFEFWPILTGIEITNGY